MVRSFWNRRLGRRLFLKESAAAGLLLSLPRYQAEAALPSSHLYWVGNIPKNPFTSPSHPNEHAGINALLELMGQNNLKFYQSDRVGKLSGPSGLIAPNDVVLIKVNAQWKYRGCTNSDVIRGLIQKILDHPDGFSGEAVIFENGQGWGNLNCDGDTDGFYRNFERHANAANENHSFQYLVDKVFRDLRVSSFLLDPIRSNFIGDDDHIKNGYRILENVSYPCFTTAGGYRVELREGLWNGWRSIYSQNLKLINVPVLKHHWGFGSCVTCSLKHMYGILSMADGVAYLSRHYDDLGEACGKMMVSVRTPVLNLVDAIWVSHGSLIGYPPETTTRTNQLLAGQDPVALDYWAAKYILYPIDNNPNHHPDSAAVDAWLTAARDTINGRGGLYDPGRAIYVRDVTKHEAQIAVHIRDMAARRFLPHIAELLLHE
jgi:uncharacterized protein (DUF362 family)